MSTYSIGSAKDIKLFQSSKFPEIFLHVAGGDYHRLLPTSRARRMRHQRLRVGRRALRADYRHLDVRPRALRRHRPKLVARFFALRRDSELLLAIRRALGDLLRAVPSGSRSARRRSLDVICWFRSVPQVSPLVFLDDAHAAGPYQQEHAGQEEHIHLGGHLTRLREGGEEGTTQQGGDNLRHTDGAVEQP